MNDWLRQLRKALQSEAETPVGPESPPASNAANSSVPSPLCAGCGTALRADAERCAICGRSLLPPIRTQPLGDELDAALAPLRTQIPTPPAFSTRTPAPAPLRLPEPLLLKLADLEPSELTEVMAFVDLIKSDRKQRQQRRSRTPAAAGGKDLTGRLPVDREH